MVAQLDGHRFKMKGVSVSRKRPPDGGGASISPKIELKLESPLVRREEAIPIYKR